jgi:hypothetical protein
MFSYGRRLKGQVYAVPPTTIENIVAKLQAAVSMAYANMLRRVRQNVMWCISVWAEAASNTRCNYEAPIF